MKGNRPSRGIAASALLFALGSLSNVRPAQAETRQDFDTAGTPYAVGRHCTAPDPVILRTGLRASLPRHRGGGRGTTCSSSWTAAASPPWRGCCKWATPASW